MENLVKIATYKRTETACFLKERLEMENIDSFFILVCSLEDKMEHVRVQVKADKVESAIRVMMETRDEYGTDIENIEPLLQKRKILALTDFSKSSEYACQYAINLARKLNAEVKLLHVFENPIADLKLQSSETYGKYLFDIAKEEEKRASDGMIKFSGKIKTYLKRNKIDDVMYHPVIAMGHIIRTIKNVCKAYQPDVMVLGTVGYQEEAKSVFTGAVKELVNELDIPVFAIPGPCRLTAFENMKILYATDFNENDHSSLNRLLKIMEDIKKQITCIHIDTAHNPAKEERIDELNVFLKHMYSNIEIRCVLLDYVNVYQGIKDYADSNEMNLLSFTIEKRSIFDMLFMPNLFKKILQEAGMPILIFPS